ncbi:glycosyltransferase [Alkaliphilus crotonatoxidans]
MEKNQLTLCILTKDHEKMLPHTLKLMKPLVGEILVMDFASKDQTPSLAREAGARLYSLEGNTYESHAKNLALSLARGRWVLFLYGSESISQKELEQLLIHLKNPNAEGYLLHLVPHFSKMPILTALQGLRLIRNRQEYQFNCLGRIDDEVLSNVRALKISVIQQEKFYLTTIGNYPLDKTQEYQEDSFFQYQYGVRCINEQQYEASLPYLHKACGLVNLDYLFAPHLYKCLCWVYLTLKRYHEAIVVATEGIGHFPFYLDLYVLRGEGRRQSGQLQEALEDLKRALEIRGQANYLIPRPEISNTIVIETLGDLHCQMLNYARGLEDYLKAYGQGRESQALLGKIGLLSQRLMNFKGLEELLVKAMELGRTQQVIKIMDILFQFRQYSLLLRYSSGLEQFLGKGNQVASIQAYCYAMLGQTKRAERCLKLVDKGSTFFSMLLLQRIELHWAGDQWQKAKELLGEMDQHPALDSKEKSLYHWVHRLLLVGEANGELELDQYESLRSIMENFLWLQKVEKARLLLLPLLKMNGKEPLVLVEAWAQVEDYEALKNIFLSIDNAAQQLQFKEVVIGKFIRSGNTALAQSISKLGAVKPQGPLEPVLAALAIEGQLQDWLCQSFPEWSRGVQWNDKRGSMDRSSNRNLKKFYQGLTGEKGLKSTQAEGFNPGTIHYKIAVYYEENRRERQALTAYIRGLQWEPLNEKLLEKIEELYRKKPDILEALPWVQEGSYFTCKEDFIAYIRGAIHFKNQEFDGALSCFLQLEKSQGLQIINAGYVATCLWFLERTEEATHYLLQCARWPEVIPVFLYLGISKAIKILNKGYCQYPDSELIELEKKRLNKIYNFRMC